MSPRRWGAAPAYVLRSSSGRQPWIASVTAKDPLRDVGQLQYFETHADAIAWAAEESAAVHFGQEDSA